MRIDPAELLLPRREIPRCFAGRAAMSNSVNPKTSARPGVENSASASCAHPATPARRWLERARTSGIRASTASRTTKTDASWVSVLVGLSAGVQVGSSGFGSGFGSGSGLGSGSGSGLGSQGLGSGSGVGAGSGSSSASSSDPGSCSDAGPETRSPMRASGSSVSEMS